MRLSGKRPYGYPYARAGTGPMSRIRRPRDDAGMVKWFWILLAGALLLTLALAGWAVRPFRAAAAV